MNGEKKLLATSASGGEAGSQTVWTNSILSAYRSLEEAMTLQRGVQRSLKLQQEVDALREELKKAQDALHRQRDMHASEVHTLRQRDNHRAKEMARLQADNDLWQVRHRVYKTLAEHYALVLLHFTAERLAKHRDRVYQHIRFHKRRGQRLSEIGTAEIVSLLQ